MAFKFSGILGELDKALKTMGKGLSPTSQAELRSLLVSDEFARLRTHAVQAMDEIPSITQPIKRIEACQAINRYRDALANAFKANIDSLSPSEALDLVDYQILHLDADFVALLDKARTRKDRARARAGGENDPQGEPKKDGADRDSADPAADSQHTTVQQPLPKPDKIAGNLPISSQATLSLLLQRGYKAKVTESQLSLLETDLRSIGLIQPAASPTFFNRQLPTNFKQALKDLNTKTPVPEEIFQRVVGRGGIGTFFPEFRIEGHRTSFWNGLNPMFWIGLPRAAESIRWRGLGDTQSLLRTTAAVALTAGIGWGGVSTYNAGHDFLFGPEAVTIAGVDATNLTAEQIKQLPTGVVSRMSKEINDIMRDTDFAKLSYSDRLFLNGLSGLDKINWLVPSGFEERTGRKDSPLVQDMDFERIALKYDPTIMQVRMQGYGIDYNSLVRRLDQHDISVYQDIIKKVIPALRLSGNHLPSEIQPSTFAAFADRFNLTLLVKGKEGETEGGGNGSEAERHFLPYTLDGLEEGAKQAYTNALSTLLKSDDKFRSDFFQTVFKNPNFNVNKLSEVLKAFDDITSTDTYIVKAVAEYFISNGALGITDPTIFTDQEKRREKAGKIAKIDADTAQEQRRLPPTIPLTRDNIRGAFSGGTGQPAAPPHPVTAPPPPDYSRSAGGETPQRLTLAVFQDAVKQCTSNPGNQATKFAERLSAAFTEVAGQGVQTLPSDRYAALLKEVTKIVNQLNVVDKTSFGYGCLGQATQMLKP